MKLLLWSSLFIFLILILVGCIHVTPSIEPTQEIKLPSVTVLPATITPVPTATFNPSATVTRSPSPIPTHPSSYLTKRCSDQIPLEQHNIMNTGSILFFWLKTDAIMSLKDNTSNPTTLVSDFSYFYVSPYSGTYLWLTPGIYEAKTSNGSYYKSEYINDWGMVRQWLLNDRIILGHFPSEHPNDRKAKDDYYILTLSTNKYEHYQLGLPEYFAIGPGFGEVASPVYDPMGSFVAYGWDNPETSDSGMLLWDIQNEKEIWRCSGWGWFPLTDQISWQYDGSRVFIVAPPIGKESPEEIFSIDRKGKETQLSNLGEVFSTTYLIYDLVISPDGNKIALSIDSKGASPYNLYSLYIFDIQTGEVIDYCTTVFQTMVWSPLSDQLAFISEPVWGEPQLVVLDIDSGKTIAINDDTRGLYGWVNWSPP